MVKRINGLNSLNNTNQSIAKEETKKQISQADVIFDNIDTNEDQIISDDEAKTSGFTSLENLSVTKEKFREIFQNYKEKTSTIEGTLKDFENVMLEGADKGLKHSVVLTKEQQKELLFRIEMFEAYRASLSEDDRKELDANKVSGLDLFSFKDRYFLPKNHPCKNSKDPKIDQLLMHDLVRDFKHIRYKDFFGLVDAVKEGLHRNIVNGNLKNDLLAKLLRLTALNDLESDGTIGTFNQGTKSDCWLLSAINVYSSSKEGAKNIKDRIKNNGDGSYTVFFNNPLNQKLKESYTITKEDLANFDLSSPYSLFNRVYSSGDKDVRILEIATEKMLNKYLSPSEFDSKNGVLAYAGHSKDYLVHKAFGYTGSIKYYTREADNDGVHLPISELKIKHEITPEGKLKSFIEKIEKVSIDKFTELIKLKKLNYQNIELTSSQKINFPFKNDTEKIYIKKNHAFSLMNQNDTEITLNNPIHANFPHVIKSQEIDSKNFIQIKYFETDNFIPINNCT